MWGELVSEAALDAKVWPRAAALGGRLWSHSPVLNSRFDESSQGRRSASCIAEPPFDLIGRLHLILNPTSSPLSPSPCRHVSGCTSPLPSVAEGALARHALRLRQRGLGADRIATRFCTIRPEMCY